MLSVYLSVIDDPNSSEEFENIYKTYRRLMIYSAYAVLRNTFDAEDAVHDAFVGAAKNFSVIAAMKPEVRKAYLCRSAKNCAVNILAKRKLTSFYEEPLPEDDIAAEASYDTMIDRLVISESFESIVRCIRSLPDTYRDTLYLYFVEEMTCAQISEKTGSKPDTVKQRIIRGKKLLAELLKKAGAPK